MAHLGYVPQDLTADEHLICDAWGNDPLAVRKAAVRIARDEDRVDALLATVEKRKLSPFAFVYELKQVIH